MNPRNAAGIALGVAGVWLIVSRLPEFGVSLVAPLWSPDGSVPWFVLVHLGVVIGCGLGLLFRVGACCWTGKIAASGVVPRGLPPNKRMQLTARQV